MENILKTCRTCSVEQPLSDFYKAPSGRDGYNATCKKCIKAKYLGKTKYEKKLPAKVSSWKSSGGKECSVCKVLLPLSHFAKSKNGIFNVNSICRSCTSNRHKIWYNEQRDKVLDMYGRVCVCCGETNVWFLTIEHKNGDGALEKKISNRSNYLKLLKEEKREDLEILCFNCNCGKHRLAGECPHKLNEEKKRSFIH